MANREWRCFHCDEVFTDIAEARRHFGDTLYRDAACQIPIAKFREIEQEMTKYRLEDTDLHREIQRLQADYAVALRREEEKGYARGLKDAGFSETLASKTESLLAEIEAVMRGEHGSDWADHFGPLFDLIEGVRLAIARAEGRSDE